MFNLVDFVDRAVDAVDSVDRAVDSVDFNKIVVDFVASVYEALVQTLSLWLWHRFYSSSLVYMKVFLVFLFLMILLLSSWLNVFVLTNFLY